MPRLSLCPEIGVWHTVRQARAILQAKDTGYTQFADHEIAEMISTPEGRDAEITDAIHTAGEEIVRQAKSLWKTGATLRQIVVIGGGSLLWGKQIAEAFPEGKVITPPEPQMVSVYGMCRYGRYLQLHLPED